MYRQSIDNIQSPLISHRNMRKSFDNDATPKTERKSVTNADQNDNVMADAIDKEDQSFLVPFYKMPCKTILKEIYLFLASGLFCSLNNSCNIIVIFVNFVYIGEIQDPVIQASFGLGVSYFMF